MLLLELYHKSPSAYQDLENDNSQTTMGDMRKTRLTLGQINQLRQMNDIRSLEYKEKLNLVKKQYAPAPEAPPGL